MAPTKEPASPSARANADETSPPGPFERYLELLKHRPDTEVAAVEDLVSTIEERLGGGGGLS
jgi:hypothetical protein